MQGEYPYKVARVEVDVCVSSKARGVVRSVNRRQSPPRNWTGLFDFKARGGNGRAEQ